MAIVNKKTYSRRDNECSLSGREKENVDPFDELLSSPFKQEVQFKPLSFWDRKVKDLGTKTKSKNIKWELYETSNSEDNSPGSRKKNPRSKYSKQKGKILPFQNISDNTNKISTVGSFIKKSKSTKAVAKVENTTLVPFKEFGKHKSQSLDNALYFSKSTSPVITSIHESCDGFKYVSIRKKTSKRNCTNKHNTDSNKCPLGIEKNYKKGTQSFQVEFEKNAFSNGVKFKVYEDTTTTEENLKDLYEKTFIDNEEVENITAHVNNSMEETLVQHNKSDDNFEFICMKRCFNNFSKENLSCIHASVGLNNETYESPSKYQSTFKENNNFEDLTFAICEENTIPKESLRNITQGISTYNTQEDSIISDKFYNDHYNATVSTLNLKEGDDETSSAYDAEDDFIDTTFCEYEILGKSLSYMKHATALNEETKTLSVLEYQPKNAELDLSTFIYNDNKNLEHQELLLQWNENSTGEAESSSASEENPFYRTEEESVLSIGSWSNRNNTLIADCEVEKEFPQLGSSSKGLSHVTMGISNLTISNAAESGEVTSEPKAEILETQEGDLPYKDTKNNSVFIDLRNVTTKRKYCLNDRHQRCSSDADRSLFSANPPEEIQKGSSPEREWELNETLEQSGITDQTNYDWNKTLNFANPIFESTRVQDISSDAGRFEKTLNPSQKMSTLLGESQVWLDHSYALKPGKKWLRSVSVLKQIRNGSIRADCFESSKKKGRKFESFVNDVLEIQNGKSGWGTSMADLMSSSKISTVSELIKPSLHSVNKFYSDLESENSLKDITFNGSNFSVSCSNGTVLETSLVNPTIKVIHPEEKPTEFGLEISNLALQGGYADTGNNSGMSGRDFVLLQCGQDDVLPFEEYFNERTLKDCKKIGEGVYGEVFRCSDVVIKIIPIEGSDKVNGEPQKTFEEILSEVVIALKLSNLRNGEKNRTDGFSEVKRCWCVKGRYPEYLLRLWDEYDQSGNGSENDSPIMFKDDQLYIILELANGGKDLESFIFSSACQSLSIFVQTALSLAAAEKTFEFEHRDLHWGNVLISETKDKFVTVVLENVEYKVPSKGVKVCIIDFTLSRIYHEGFCIFNDLSVDPTLFTSEGDYQFEIYRMMLREVRNDWSLFRPKTNIFWLHYTLDKMINMVRYKNKKTKLHKKGERDLKILESVIIGYKDTTEFVLSDSLRDVMKRL